MNEILNSLNKARRAKRLAESENTPKERKMRESVLAQEAKNVTRRMIHEDLEDPEETDQEYTSAETSINSAKLPAIYNLVKFKPGQVVLDYGGGKFDNGIEFLEAQGCKGYVYDPYNRDNAYNQATLKAIREAGGADVVLISNVLNVINTASARKTTLNNAKRLMKAGGTCYITVYEGSGTGEGGVTQKGKSFQVNKKTKDYVDEIAEVFNNVTRKGKLIIAEGREIKRALLSEATVAALKNTGSLRDMFDTYTNATAAITREEFQEKFKLTPKTVTFTFAGWDGKSYDGETRTSRIYKMADRDEDFIKVGKSVHMIDYDYMYPEKTTGEEHPVAAWVVDVARG